MHGYPDKRLVWLGLTLLVAGFFGHFFAAMALGPGLNAWRDHMLGFAGLTVISALIVGTIGWRFWRGRRDITLLIVGVIQLVIGIMVYRHPV
jgi:hypothetical protein